jgi:hypothetical protein
MGDLGGPMKNGWRPAASVMACLFLLVSWECRISRADSLDAKHAGFGPKLWVNAEPACSVFLAAARAGFQSTEALGPMPSSMEDSFKASGLRLVDLSSSPYKEDASEEADNEDVSSVVVNGTRLFLRFQTQNGCGGACESSAVLVSSDPTGLKARGRESSDSPIATTEYSRDESWSVYQDKRGAYYIAGISDDHLLAYRIADPKDWHVTCDVSLVPTDEFLTQSSVAPTVGALSDLELATEKLTGGGGGSCGSMRTPDRWAQTMHHALLEAVYRPWASRSLGEPASKNTYGDYERDFDNLVQWSFSGLYEYNALSAYRKQFEVTSRQLARYYEAVLQWPAEKASFYADQNLKNAISQGIGFYLYDRDIDADEQKLRQAILWHRPVSDISALITDAVKAGSNKAQESILDVAVTYPEALRVLLDKGVDPNVANAFGKTPLMYAVQYNQYEAAQLLLSHGADPNAATTWAEDTCNYVLHTARMTPLHYAVRYGSAQLVHLLLSYGAVTFRQTELLYGPPGEFPVDWLRKYTAADKADRNPNLSDSDRSALETLLRVPDEAERTSISKKLTFQAEADNGAGKTEAAYRDLSNALAAKRDNHRALTDLPLIALKAGRLGESLEAANAIIAAESPPAEKAAAWFNRGLACEQKTKPVIGYNGKYYCMDSLVFPFLMAWKLQPSDARAHKIKALFDGAHFPVCSVKSSDVAGARFYFAMAFDDSENIHSQTNRVYVLHSKTQVVDPTMISWRVWIGGQLKSVSISPQLVERIDLGDQLLTVLGSQYSAQEPVTIGDEICQLTKW